MSLPGSTPRLRPTGEAWCPSVPAGWQFLPLRRLGTLISGGTPAADDSNWGGEIPFVTPPDLREVTGGTVEATARSLTTQGASKGSSIAPEGGVLLSIRAPIGYVARTTRPMAFNQGCRAIVPAASLDARFLTFVLVAASPELEAQGRGTTFMELSAAQLAAISVPVPPLPEQRAIADFLDRETGQIDRLIEKQEQLIDTLRERRVAVISRLVSQGLADTPSKAGNTWYSMIPSHWHLARVKSIALLVTDGAHISPETEGGTWDFVSTRDVKAGRIDFRGALKTDDATYRSMVRTGCQPLAGDVLFSKDGTIGETALVRSDHPFVVASSLVIIRPRPQVMLPAFLSQALRSPQVLDQATVLVRGAGLPRISVQNVGRLVLPVPPLNEQRAIADHLDNQTGRIDVLIARAERFIGLARERRAALVSAAVTGRIDVRAAV